MKNDNELTKRSIWLIFTAIGSAFAATLCCLPALLFLLFGTSFSFLSWAEAMSEYRWALSAVAVTCFVLSAGFLFRSPTHCKVGAGRKKWIFIYVLIGFLLVLLLAYPEILGRFYA